jgi:hypothetical protein
MKRARESAWRLGQDATVDIKMQRSTPDACASGHEFATTDCALTWHGITLYGAYDVGVGWVSHGLPENATNYEGESLVNRNGYQHRFLIAPNNLQQTGLGIRGKEEFLHGWSVVFNASTGINPQSGELANASATMTSTTAFPGAAIRKPSTARARANPSMTNSMPVYRPRLSAR